MPGFFMLVPMTPPSRQQPPAIPATQPPGPPKPAKGPPNANYTVFCTLKLSK